MAFQVAQELPSFDGDTCKDVTLAILVLRCDFMCRFVPRRAEFCGVDAEALQIPDVKEFKFQSVKTLGPLLERILLAPDSENCNWTAPSNAFIRSNNMLLW